MEKAFVLDYKKTKHFLDIDIADVESVDVFTSYGDEVVTFHMCDGTAIEVDAGDFIGGRSENEKASAYTVPRSKLAEWQTRTDSDSWFAGLMLSALGIK